MEKKFVKVLAVCCCAFVAACGQGAEDAAIDYTEAATRLARESVIVDTHIDIPYRLEERWEDISEATEFGDFDYPRAKAGGLDAAFMSIYIPAELEPKGEAVELADKLIDMVEGIAADHPGHFALASSVDDVLTNFAAGRISLALGMENGAPIDGSFENLRHFYDRGIRYITLAHSKSNHISDSSYDENRQWFGLSEFGKSLIPAMNDIGIMIDVSHISDTAFYQVLEISKAPVIASHSAARHFTPGWERNMSDDMIARLSRAGGVVQINFGSSFISQQAWLAGEAERDARKVHFEQEEFEDTTENSDAFRATYRAEHPYPYATLDQVLDVFDHVTGIAGIDHVGIGSDYDGVGDSLPEGLKDVSGYPNLIRGLLGRGYGEDDVRKILSGNILRVWSEVEIYAASRRQGKE